MSDSQTPAADIVARAGRYYRNARYLIVAMAFAAGLWFGYDGWINWPSELRNYNAMSEKDQAAAHKPHSDLDILLQRLLSSTLVPLSPILLCLFLYRSRGEYRLSGTTLHVPGHPPIAADAMTSLDMSKWKRKGIARLEYKVAGSESTRQVRLDDFVYDQAPTDKIVEQIDGWLNPESDTPAEESEPVPEQSSSTEA